MPSIKLDGTYVVGRAANIIIFRSENSLKLMKGRGPPDKFIRGCKRKRLLAPPSRVADKSQIVHIQVESTVVLYSRWRRVLQLFCSSDSCFN